VLLRHLHRFFAKQQFFIGEFATLFWLFKVQLGQQAVVHL
jgi:hypothetical protein